ncbi:MAG: J domain-containing protein [Alphaproteobacteria bacterium]|nr:J domain-containing protein [Alphaproteobacteria bacterium]
MPGCTAIGRYPAPRARNALKDYYWFCLPHVREYNAAWNYYAGMNEADIERHIRADTTWWRPTWPLGTGRGPTMRPERMWFSDAFNVFGEEWAEGTARAGAAAEDDRRRSRAVTPEERALAVLELSPPVTRARVKARYLELVKRLHPDANGGDKSAEEKLKLINRAYTTLKNAQLG